jgi:quinol monooxygenase YgiN
MQHWFVYYKLAPSSARELEPRLRGMQAEIAAERGVRARLMRRTDTADGPVTLLEVYDDIAQPGPFEQALSAAVARAGLPASLVEQRRTERFEDL